MTRSKWFAGAIALGMFFCSGSAMAQDKKPEGKPADKPAAAKPESKKDAKAGGAQEGGTPPGMTAEEAKCMELMMTLGQPADEHKAMAAHFVGTWDTESKMFMGPGEPMTSKGSCKSTAIFDGRYITEEYEGDMMGQPFKGMSLSGYDRINKQYVNTWIDSMSTGTFNSTGTYDASKKAYTYKGDMCMPTEDGKVNKMPIRMVITINSNDKHTFEWFEMKDGKETKTMEITYTRRKAA
ncbi:MAG: DUF1579 domain-containing protein [Phycisphaerae bacterium]